MTIYMIYSTHTQKKKPISFCSTELKATVCMYVCTLYITYIQGQEKLEFLN